MVAVSVSCGRSGPVAKKRHSAAVIYIECTAGRRLKCWFQYNTTMEYFFHTADFMKSRVLRYPSLFIAAFAVATLAACSADESGSAQNAAAAEAPAIAARLATETTFRHAAIDSALWVDAQQPGNSLLLVSGGEGGLEVDDLSGKRIARFESLEV